MALSNSFLYINKGLLFFYNGDNGAVNLGFWDIDFVYFDLDVVKKRGIHRVSDEKRSETLE